MHTANATKEAPPGAHEDLHAQILKNIRESRSHFTDWRTAAKEDYAFYAGEQWDTDDKNLLAEQNRPCVTFNRVARTINAVAGLELQNRQEVRYFPREIRDGIVAELLSDAAKWARDNCDAEDEESESFIDSLICGMGWTETRLDYETDAEGMILIERRDPFEMGVDHCAKKRNFDDARFVYRLIEYTREEFERRFPDADVPGSRFFDIDEQNQPLDRSPDPAGYSRGLEDDSDKDAKTVQVCQYQYWETEHVRPIADPTGQLVDMPEERFQQVKDQLDEQGVRYAGQPRPKRVYCQVFLSATEVLSKEPAPCNMFTLRAMTGLRDRNENIWFGLVRLMKDPQRWANKWMSQIQHILNSQAKSGKLMYETGAVKDPRKFKSEWADVTKPAELNAGAISQQKIMQLEASRYPDGLDRILQYAIAAVNDAPGVSIELLGLTNRDQAGVVEDSRKQAGITVLASFFDGLRRYRKEQGRVLASFIQDYIADGRLIRINSELGPQAVPLIRDKMALKYDVIVDDAPSSTNMKERTFSVLQTVLPFLFKANIPVPPDLLDFTPLPEALTQKWKQFIQGQQNDPEQQQMKQLQTQALAAETQGKQAKAQLDMANAHKAMAEAQGAGQGDQAEQARMLHELQLKREEIGATLQLKQQESQSGLQLKHHEAQSELQLAQAKAAAEIESNERIAAADIASKERIAMVQAALATMVKQQQAEMSAQNEAQANDNQAQSNADSNQSVQVISETFGQAMETLAEAIKHMSAPKKATKDAKTGEWTVAPVA